MCGLACLITEPPSPASSTSPSYPESLHQEASAVTCTLSCFNMGASSGIKHLTKTHIPKRDKLTWLLSFKMLSLNPPPDSGWREAQTSPWGKQGYGVKLWGFVTSLGSKLADSIRAEGKIWPGQCSLSYSPSENQWLRLHPHQGSQQPQRAGLPAHRHVKLCLENLSVCQLTTYHLWPGLP